MKRYKAYISEENFRSFVEYYNADKAHVEKMLKQVRELFPSYKDPVYEKAQEMFDRHFMANKSRENTFSLENQTNQKLQILIEYTAKQGLGWNVIQIKEKFLYLSFSGKYLFWDKNFCTLSELPDYESMSMSEVRGRIETDAVSSMLPAERNSLSIDCVNEEKDLLQNKKEEIEKIKDDIQFERTIELAKIEKEIRKLQNEMYERKQALLLEVNEKLSALQKVCLRLK